MTKIKLAKQKLEILDELATNLEYRKKTDDAEWMSDEDKNDNRQFNKMIDELIAQIEKLI